MFIPFRMSREYVVDRVQAIRQECIALFFSSTDLDEHSPLRFQYQRSLQAAFSQYVFLYSNSFFQF